ncbi:MAG: Ig-like domain-containing protein [Defluviitaleaceae bacterium]|nr:Ig-like domain-containing protein [Defluviitaleaceae bacterium]
MRKHFKKIVAIVLAVVLLISAVVIFPLGRRSGDALIGAQEVHAAERTFDAVETASGESQSRVITPLAINEAIAGQTSREGYILAPTMFCTTGVDTLSSFVLRTEADYGREIPAISIDGQLPPTIFREDNHTFLITPAIPLTANSVYVFRLAREGQDITWAFQTARQFGIISTLPRNQSVNVPVRTGIEISFSYGEGRDISDYFSISPAVEGEFIHRDSTVIFMPTSPLDYGRVYTVTIDEGVGLTSNHVFSFETAIENEEQFWSSRRDSNIHFSFAGRYVEFPTFAVPSVDFWLSHWGTSRRPVIEFSVYQIDDRARAIEAVGQFIGIHNWAMFAFQEYLMDTTGMTQISTTTVHERLDGANWNETFTLPNNLPAGFYLVNAAVDDNNHQVIIQVTDIAVQVIADENRALVWVNDMNTGGPVNAEVFDPIRNRTFTTTEYGIAVVERGLTAAEHLIVRAGGVESVVFMTGFQSFFRPWFWDSSFDVEWDMPISTRSWGWSPWGGNQTANNQYWTALQLDRTLFQRNDTLSLWGFVQNRHRNENINHVTVVLSQHSWWHMPDTDTLLTQNIPVAYGAFSGEIRLPHLDTGSYEITIYHGDIMLRSMVFSVQDYVTPPYQLIVSADRVAIFAGDEVNFTARTQFFEGTPVPDLSLNYNLSGHELNVSRWGTARTDSDGNVSWSARPAAANSSVQGQRTLSFWADATLPEIGHVHQHESVRVFVNDIRVRPRASREGRDATLSIDIHNITLDRLNDGTAEHHNDFLDTPRASHSVSVEIVELYWERVRDGQFYDHVTREVIPRYRHVLRETTLERFDMTTNAEGFAERNFQVPDRERRSYEARITTRDGNGRTIRHNAFIGRDWTSFFRNADDTRLFLYGGNDEGYALGDQIELTIMRGAEPVAQGNFLFVVVADGILSYHIGTNPLNITFGEQHVPNAQVFAYHFNGHTFNTGGAMSQRLRYNPEGRELIINIEICQESYRPGDTPTFTITTTDLTGRPRAANVNISLVDEALFSLMDYTVDTLAMLYANINDTLRFSLATHSTFVSEGRDTDDVAEDAEWSMSLNSAGGRAFASADMAMAPQAAIVAESEVLRAGAMYGAGAGEDTRIRARFEDTAVFASTRTNAQGRATITFPLPDNVTSWRVTASAISDDLYAGNSVSNVRVTLPMFVHYTLNNVFLVGDVPTIGVNAFGTSLTGGEEVTFTVWGENAQGERTETRTATGVAFERVNIPLWEKSEEGFGTIVVRAEVAGYSDAVRHEFQVLNSHRLIDTAVFYNDVTSSTVFATNDTGLTNITFTDQGRGQFLDSLFGLRHTWWSGARLEALVARREANILIRQHFPDVRLFGEAGNFNVREYQQECGGIAVLPHAEAELEVTVMLIPFIQNDVNIPALRNYLRNIADTSTTDNRMMALYGLAMLNEPVLMELQRYVSLDNLSVRNTAYLALGFAALGETQTAHGLYTERIAPHIQRIAPYYRVDVGANRLEIVNTTSITALLAAQLGMPESMGLHNYASAARVSMAQPRNRQRHDNMQVNIERLKFITHEIENHTGTTASITYRLFGETVTRELGHGGQFTLRIPAQSMNEFSIVSTTGEVSAVSIIRVPLEDMETIENDITVRRQFFRAGTNTAATTFAQDELVRVQITVNYSARDLSGMYVITDFLPAGLVLVQNSAVIRSTNSGSNYVWRAWATTEGQRVTFFDHNTSSRRVQTYYYYARVINAGTFRAEGTIVQSVGAREYLVVGDGAVLTIN